MSYCFIETKQDIVSYQWLSLFHHGCIFAEKLVKWLRAQSTGLSVSGCVRVSFEEKEMRVFTIALALTLTLTLFQPAFAKASAGNVPGAGLEPAQALLLTGF